MSGTKIVMPYSNSINLVGEKMFKHLRIVLISGVALFAQSPEFKGKAPLEINGAQLFFKYKPPAIALGDYNHDGLKDLIIGEGFNTDFGGGVIRVYLNGGTNTSPLYSSSELLKAGGQTIKLTNG